MAHLVRHRTPTGEVTTEEVADLDTALARVEALRNAADAGDVRLFREVPLHVETVVRVSVAEEGPPAPTEATAHEPEDVPPVPPSEPVEPPPGAMLAPVRVDAPSADADDLVDAEVAATRRGLFHRG